MTGNIIGPLIQDILKIVRGFQCFLLIYINFHTFSSNSYIFQYILAMKSIEFIMLHLQGQVQTLSYVTQVAL